MWPSRPSCGQLLTAAAFVALVVTAHATNAAVDVGNPSLPRPRPLPSRVAGSHTTPGHIRGGATTESRVMDGLKNGVASGLASACARAVLQPFDCVKTAQQASTAPLSMLDAGRALMERSGTGALYSGLLVAIFGSVPSISLYFAVYQYAKRMLQDRWARDGEPVDRWHAAASVALAAATGNFCASWLRPPYEVVKQRLQAGIYPGPVSAAAAIYEAQGLRGFWVGVVAQMARDIPDAVVTLLLYEFMQAEARERRNTERLSPMEHAVLGAAAGGVGALVSNPMDVVKTRVMTSVDTLIPSVAAVVRKIVREEGMSTFGKGALPRVLHKVPTNSIFFLCYESFRKLLHVRQ